MGKVGFTAAFVGLAVLFGCEQPSSRTIVEAEDGSMAVTMDKYKELPDALEERRQRFLFHAIPTTEYSTVQTVHEVDFDSGEYIGAFRGWIACGTLKTKGKEPGTYQYGETYSDEGNQVLIYYWSNQLDCDATGNNPKPTITRGFSF